MVDPRKPLLEMLRQLLREIEIYTSQGAGYYTCIPFARRYNKLLAQAQKLFADEHGIIDTFDTAPESDPKDPGEKGKYLIGIRVDIGQLITFLEATREG
ncbi:MAG: hypothetical protein IT368_00530 [Candidatus Hydrogenedentes bacterium]|nr:hypothetical protein [Candidatus Hydrogenedentota bacterium]